MILVRRCNYEEDQKKQKILVGYGSLAETSVFHHNPYFLATPYRPQTKMAAGRFAEMSKLTSL